MKVFTVGLEQKPPLEEGEKKSTSPPPGYSTTEARIPLPLGPEMPRAPLPPQPIIVRKSRGYKGILLVMLSVFLMAVFALVLSEMAYNRQRDENFFKLRWAELKHRMGYETDGPMEYYQRAAASIGDKFDRMLNLAKSNEINPPVAQSLSVDEDDATTSSTSSPPPTPPEPVVAIDTFPMKPDVSLGSSSSNSRSSQASFEIEPPQPPMFPGAGLGNALGQIRDARLQFLRNILQKIKQHAEDIGFDGTMQVSIIEVEPQNGMGGNDGQEQQNGDNNANNMNGPFGNMMGPFQRQLIIQQPNQQPQPQFPVQFPQMPSPQNFFPHPRPLVDDFKNSRSFLDGFGEFHQPNFMQNNQVNEPDEQQRPRMFGPMPNEFPPMGGSPPMPPMMQMQQQQMQQNGPPEFMENNMRWPRINAFRQPEMLFFHPIFPQQMNLRFPPPPPPSAEWAQPPQQPQQIGMNPALARPSSFDRWNQQGGQQQQQQQQPQMGGIPQGVLMAGEQPQQQIQQQQQPQAQLPQQQQIQIDFPEVKLPPPVISGDSTEDKFPVAPPQQQQGQKSQPQAQQQPRDWLPKWLTENMPTMVNNNAGGPPAQQPAEMVKFPSVTVLEPASNQQQGAKQIADNENREGGENMGREEGKVVDSARGEIGGRIDDGQPEEVVEVDAAPQQNEQQQPQQQGQSEGQTQQQGQQNGGPQGQQQQQQQMGTVPLQKWFPEVPSVFFQVDDPNDQQQQQPLVPQAQQQQPATQQQQQSADQPQQGTLGQPQSEH